MGRATLILILICYSGWQARGFMAEETEAEKRGDYGVGWKGQAFFRQQRQQPRNFFRASKRGGNYFRASKRMSEGEELNTEMEDQDPVLYNLMKMLTQLEMHQDREEE